MKTSWILLLLATIPLLTAKNIHIHDGAGSRGRSYGNGGRGGNRGGYASTGSRGRNYENGGRGGNRGGYASTGSRGRNYENGRRGGNRGGYASTGRLGYDTNSDE